MKASELLIRTLIRSSRQGLVKWVKTEEFQGEYLDAVYKTEDGIEPPFIFVVAKITHPELTESGYLFLTCNENRILDSITSDEINDGKLLEVLFQEASHPSDNNSFRNYIKFLLKENQKQNRETKNNEANE